VHPLGKDYLNINNRNIIISKVKTFGFVFLDLDAVCYDIGSQFTHEDTAGSIFICTCVSDSPANGRYVCKLDSR